MRLECIAALVVLMIAPTGRSDGAMISYGPTPISSPDTGGMTSLSFPQFDPSLGTLTGLTYAITQETGTPIRVAFQNRAAQPILFGFFPVFDVDIRTPNLDSPPFNFFPPGFPPLNFQLAAYGGSPNFTGPDSMTTNINFGNGSDTRTYTGANFQDFIGTGQVTAQLTTALRFLVRTNLPAGTPAANQPAMEYITPGSQSANFTVTYTYSTPAPPSLALVASGGLAAFALARRRATVRQPASPSRA